VSAFRGKIGGVGIQGTQITNSLLSLFLRGQGRSAGHQRHPGQAGLGRRLRPDVYQSAGFKEKQGELEAAGQWKLVDATEEFQPLPKGEPEVMHQVWVYQVAS
jgi:hypothetical protein